MENQWFQWENPWKIHVLSSKFDDTMESQYGSL